MAEIIPAIIGQEFTEIRQKIDRVEGLVDWVQIDIIDGIFAPNWSWNRPDDLKSLNGKLKIEVHLMIEQPEQYLNDWLEVADRVLVHYESTDRLEQIFDQLGDNSSRLGLALLASTPVEVLEKFKTKVKHVQLMSIAAIGFHGQPFVNETVGRVASVHSQYPDVTIAVDGGVDLNNALGLVSAGATHLVVGSAIWQSNNLATTIADFKKVK